MAAEPVAGKQKLTDILLELHRTRQSCLVRCERAGIKKQLTLSQGALTFAESNQPEEHLAKVLVKLEYLQRKDLKKVADFMKGGKNSEEAVVLATGLDGGRLQEGVYEQALMILSSLLATPGFEVRLFEDEGRSSRRVRLMLPVPQALVEAARRAAKGRLVPPGSLSARTLLIPVPAAGVRANLPLNGDEAFAYSQIRGSLPLARLLEMFPSGGNRHEEVVQCLLLLGLLRVEAPREESAGREDGGPGALLFEKIDEQLRRFEVSNYYEILSVPSQATEDEVKAAYHELARLYHPDRFESDGYSVEFRARVEELFTYITGAYATLGDPAARARYDETRLRAESQVEAALQGRSAVDLDKEKMAEALFRAGRAAMMNADYERAADHLRECVWLYPDTARYHHYLGSAQSEIPRLRKEAEQHFLKAIHLEQTNPESYLGLGKLYVKVNLHKRAEAQFCEALHWDPENAEALQQLQSLAQGARR